MILTQEDFIGMDEHNYSGWVCKLHENKGKAEEQFKQILENQEENKRLKEASLSLAEQMGEYRGKMIEYEIIVENIQEWQIKNDNKGINNQAWNELKEILGERE